MIRTIIEKKRGCGYRKPGGLYLIGGGAFHTCGILPIALTVCPCCQTGIKPARGFTWTTPDLWKKEECPDTNCKKCSPFFDKTIEKVGLMWVGEKFYPTGSDFTRESMQMGVSKRIAQIPKDLEIGKTWVLLAHRKPEAHIFGAFIPQRIEYVVRDTDTPETIEAMEKRGVTCVRVIPDGQPNPMPEIQFPD